ncbi:hypothetical protein [Flavobacterium sp.]|uniref:hypothetical protein n=1 Tax=Flavobacterium sp. TaxID=239 RepID=UPI0026114817|nr:hypothetical protein [Flavobacterium sp.]
MKTITKTILLSFALLLLNCKESSKEKKNETSIQNAVSTIEDTSSYHVDTTYQYENRTGTSGNYKYNYDVIGFDSKGNEVTGNISIEGKEGIGYLFDTNQNKIKVIVEWTGHGKLKAIDNHNNQYELEVE